MAIESRVYAGNLVVKSIELAPEPPGRTAFGY